MIPRKMPAIRKMGDVVTRTVNQLKKYLYNIRRKISKQRAQGCRRKNQAV
jgi:hypothetical protein